MSARSLFIGGTSSNAGKSWMATAMCAWLRGHGVSVAPFKAQNMSNNSFPCRSGGEIGRAQVAQAEACGLEPEPAMNPILLKPCGEGRSQVVVNGSMWKTVSAREFYASVTELRQVVLDAYGTLARRFDVVIVEGAGSVSELNLKGHDLVNLGLVSQIRSPWLLVADIERGGVFASILGTISLLSSDERSLFRGFAINKFQGDPTLFDDGVRLLEDRTGAPCFGVFPYAMDIQLDAEDSLALDTKPRTQAPAGARVAIIHLPHLSNATDFRLLTWADWIRTPPAADYDFIILPGTKNTIRDLDWLRGCGLADWLLAQHRRGARIIGICGGYQILGQAVLDPSRIESDCSRAEGLGMLPVTTELRAQKQTRAVSGKTSSGVPFGAYEIHVGVTTSTASPALRPFALLDDGTADGVQSKGVIGTYLHGIFEHAAVCADVFGIDAPQVLSKSEHYNRLAAWFGEHARHVDELGLCR
jgi:adenosylcobyric acid synthase